VLSSSCAEGTGLSSSPHGNISLQGKGQNPSTRGGSTLLRSQFQPYPLTDNIPTKYYGLLSAVVDMQKGKRNIIHSCSCTDSRFCNHSSPLLSPLSETHSAPTSEFSRPFSTQPVALEMETDIQFQPHQHAKRKTQGIH